MDTFQVVTSYFQCSENQANQLEQLKPLYSDWNSKINVISRKNMDDFYVQHVLHSLGISRVISFAPGTSVVDVGTGGGFPGIPLAILFPEVHFHLVDSIGKKIKVVEGVADALGLKNVSAQHARIETLSETFDFVVSRAVTRMKPFYQWVRPLIAGTNRKATEKGPKNSLSNGILYLKGGDLDSEMKELGKPYTEHSLANDFKEPFFETKKVVYVKVTK